MPDQVAVSASEQDDDLIRHRQQFNDYVDSTGNERKDAEQNRDYFDNIQWDAQLHAKLRARGQPVITDNKIKDKVEYMMGVEQKTRTDPKAYPRTPTHEQDSEIATDSIRYVFDLNRFPTIKSAVFQNLLVEGFGACEVTFDKAKDEVSIQKCRWDRLYRDPYSMEPDCSDARYFGLITWMDFERAKEKWPRAEKFLEVGPTTPARSTGDTQDDTPRWVDAKRKRVQVFDHYEWRRGALMKAVFCWGGYLESPKECPYMDDQDPPEHDPPLKFCSAYVSRDGRRYGLVSRYLPLQDEVNQRRSAALYNLVAKGVVADKGAVENVAKTIEELQKPAFYLEVNPEMRFDIQQNMDVSAGHFQLLQQAEAALSMTGPNAALLGQSGAISGRAKELDQQGGSLQVGVLFDVIRSWQQSVARSVWYRIKQYWDTEDFIRVTDDEDKVKFIALNQPILQGDVMAEKLKSDPEFHSKPPEEQQFLIQQMAADPAMQQPVLENGKIKRKNDISKIDVDIIIDEAPDTITIQAEQFEKLARLAETGSVQIPPDALIEASSLTSQVKKKITDAMKGENDPNAAERAQIQEMMVKLTAALQAAQVRKTTSEAEENEAQTEEIRARTTKTGIEAATHLADATDPLSAAADPNPTPPPGSRAFQAA